MADATIAVDTDVDFGTLSTSSSLRSSSESDYRGAVISTSPEIPRAGTLGDVLQFLGQGQSSQPPAEGEAEKSATATEAPKDPSKNGAECRVKLLYEGAPKCTCCINWVEQYPDDLREFVDDAEDTKNKAIVARMKKNHKDGKPLALDSVVIQNAPLKAFLAKLFRDYEGITPQLKKLVFRAPFHPFFHSWDSFQQLMKQVSNEEKEYVSLLFNLLQPEIGPVIDETSDMVANHVITYELLWTLFSPKRHLYSEIHSQGCMYIFESCGYEEEGFSVLAKYIDWDGKQFGYASRKFTIPPFANTKPISKLDIYPLHLHESPDAKKAQLLQRGTRFVDLCSAVQHKTYVGSALYEDQQRRCFGEIYLDERVMLDTTLSPYRPKSLSSLKEGSDKPAIELADRQHEAPFRSQRRCGNYMDYDDARESSKILDPRATAKHAPIIDLSLTDDELVLCSSMLTAWCLTTKQWVWLLEIDNLQAISWNENAFSKVVLPANHKDLVLSFVEAHISGDVKFDDIIKGKGLGLLMLLVGDPGLGKTLTAEALAEKVQQPLYTLTAGELGQEPNTIETALVRVLSMTAKWNAVLLLDECDVFLEERSSSRLEHNAIVAVFLRVIEYHKGILIMTSNRGSSIDRAFQSRIHLTLRYPGLTVEAKATIFRHFIQGSNWTSGNTVTPEQYEKLATLPINGREIKNLVKTAFLLASRSNAALSLEHIKKVVDATIEEDW